ncbi:uncharacterized protein [Mytilus edulis]|uniref:uncharacterized protein n=1 Tax=Mytilus edulis TaxID=6550 RepID=UPI0039EEC40B
MPAINSLLCSGNDLIYFIDQNARLVKGQLQESSIKTLQTLDKKIFDIAVNKEGEILFKEMISNNVVCILTHKGKIRTVVDTSPMRPLSLHINKDNELIVGLREHGPAFPVTEFSVRQVIIFDSDYERKVLLETDKKGKKLFCYPARITTDSKNVLYVADWMDEYHGGRIVAVDVNGRLKFTYNGDLYLETFLSHGIAITPSDNIILSDEKSNSLHILNSRGELLGLHFIEKEYDIEKPHSLCIDSEGYLLIGRGLIKGSDAKIYMVKIAEHFMIL